MPVQINKLPPVPVLRSIFTADFEEGKLYWGPTAKRHKGCEAGYPNRHLKNRRMVVLEEKTYSVSRILWAMHSGRDPGPLYIDHINGDPSDNRIVNLRPVTPGENGTNKLAYCKTGVRSVYELAPLKDGTRRFSVQLCRSLGRRDDGSHMRKTFCFGVYKTLDEAARRAAEVHAEWGMLDFMRDQNTNIIKKAV